MTADRLLERAFLDLREFEHGSTDTSIRAAGLYAGAVHSRARQHVGPEIIKGMERAGKLLPAHRKPI
jgi:hypothetical protein